MTIIERLQKGEVPDVIKRISEEEGISLEDLIEKILQGRVVVPHNVGKVLEKPCGIGEGLRTKVNANIGTSQDLVDVDLELKKLAVAVEAGADCVMDLSSGGDLDAIRKRVLANSPVPVGTVPIYQAAIEAAREHGSIVYMTPDTIIEAIRKHAEDGVDFMTVHCGITLEGVERLKREGRVVNIVSRGGAFLAVWMVYNERENPLYEHFDRILEIAREYDVTLSLGDALRPGGIDDATDRAQIQELIVLGELVDRAREAGVQVMVEGPGHVPLDQVEMNVKLQKRLCHGAPFYVLGPLVTDIAPGYDHISGAIGGAIAAAAGADFICYVTPSEHLRLPDVEDVKEGVIAARIAGHAADIVKGVPGAREWDLKISQARQRREWEKHIELAIDPDKASRLRESSMPAEQDVCTMCGKFCALKVVEDILKGACG